MRILKNTRKDPAQITCPHCDSELEYVYSDLRREERYDILSRPLEPYIFVICPVCKENIYLKRVGQKREAKNEDT